MKRIMLEKKPNENVLYVKSDKLVKIVDIGVIRSGPHVLAELRTHGDFEGTAIALSDGFHWELGRDTEGVTILIPLLVGE